MFYCKLVNIYCQGKHLVTPRLSQDEDILTLPFHEYYLKFRFQYQNNIKRYYYTINLPISRFRPPFPTWRLYNCECRGTLSFGHAPSNCAWKSRQHLHTRKLLRSPSAATETGLGIGLSNPYHKIHSRFWRLIQIKLNELF